MLPMNNIFSVMNWIFLLARRNMLINILHLNF